MMAKKISLINMKGGVGKSTLAVNLAWQYAGMTKWIKKVLVVDLDPQFNASQYLLGQTVVRSILDQGKPTVWDIFEQLTRTPGASKPKALNPADLVHNVITFHDGSRIDLIPSRLELAYSLRSPEQKEQLLTKFLSKIEEQYDVILIDCAPTESFLTMAAYLASNYILVPVKPEYLSTIGLPLLVRSMEEFHDHHEDHDLQLAGIVFNSTTDYIPEEAKSKAEVKSIAKQNGWYVFEAEVTYSRSYPKGAREGRPIFRTSYSRSSQAHKFHNFAQELAGRIGL
jgi:chromosome partitioning protein